MAKIHDQDKFYIELGENIKTYRTKLGYSQEDLAKFLGLNRTSVVNIERGRQRPPIHVLSEIASFLNVSVPELYPSANKKYNEDEFLKFVRETIDSIEKRFKTISLDKDKFTHFLELADIW